MAIFSNVEPLKMWVHKILPLVYDDSMSYYETLCKVVQKLNEVVELSNEQTEYLNNWLTSTEESLSAWKTDTQDALEEKINTDLGAAIDRLETEFADELLDAEGMIYGTQNGQPVEVGSEYYENNAEFFKEQASEAAIISRNYANGGNTPPPPLWAQNNSKYFRERAEAWAVGEVNGADVPDTDDTYENNAKYYAEQAEAAALTFIPDPTLTEAGRPADAKATGDAVAELNNEVDDLKRFHYDETEIDYDDYTKNAVIINPNNNWSNNGIGEAKTIVIPITEGTKSITVENIDSEHRYIVAFLRDINGMQNPPAAAHFSQNYIGRIISGYGDTNSYTVEDDMNYLYLVYTNSSGVTNPPYIYFYSEKIPERDINITRYVSALPEEYEQLEYLESHGDAYINTHESAGNLTRMVLDFQIVDEFVAGAYSNNVAGGRYIGSREAYYFIANKSGQFGIGYYDTVYPIGNADFLPHKLDINRNKFYLDGELKYTADDTEFTIPSNKYIFLFACNATSQNYYGKARIYHCKIYQEDVLTCEMIPCRRINDNALGMYDIVNDIFRAKGGTGELVAGEINSITNAVVNATQLYTDNYIEKAPKYIQAEADKVADKVRKIQTGTTISFVAISDLHYSVDDYVVRYALSDARYAIKAIANQAKIDFYASFGDIIYRLSENGNFDKGKAEIIGCTKLLSDAFGNNKQLRITGNHDPNAEGSTGYFTAYELNAYTGIYNDILTKGVSYGNLGYWDDDIRKIRFIVINTSFYSSSATPAQGATQYSYGTYQAKKVCEMLDLSNKSDMNDWKIVLFSHCNLDMTEHTAIGNRTDVIYHYLKGDQWSVSGESYDFTDKNGAKIIAAINGHWHQYNIMNLNYTSGSNIVETLNIAKLYVPNALPGRDYTSMDGETYTKTANSANSTAFQVITIDSSNSIIYAHHYGAGIDVISHYDAQTISTSTTLTPSVTTPEIWESKNTAVATVSEGVVTPVANGNTTIWCKSATDGCIEAWNITVSI